MKEPTVSCIIPAYNAERFLAEAIRSALDQTRPLHEIVVVNDASTDGTADVARAFGDQVHLVEIEHAGIMGATDAGLAASTGELVACLDADDLWVPEKTALQVKLLQSRPDVDLCVGHYLNFWEPDLADEEERYRDHPHSQPTAGYIVPAMMARRTVFERFGSFTAEGSASNTAWFTLVVERGAVLETLPDVVLRRRIHRRNTSTEQDLSLDGLFDLISVRRRIRGRGDGGS